MTSPPPTDEAREKPKPATGAWTWPEPGVPRPVSTSGLACPQCGYQHGAEDQFCGGCGRSLIDRDCPNCKSRVPAGHAFCSACGLAVQGQAPAKRGGCVAALLWAAASLLAVAAALAVAWAAITAVNAAQVSSYLPAAALLAGAALTVWLASKPGLGPLFRRHGTGSKAPRVGRTRRRIVTMLAGGLILTSLATLQAFRLAGLQVFQIDGYGMLPSFPDRTMVISRTNPEATRRLEARMVVLFKDPEMRSGLSVKRIVAVPGDQVAFKSGKLVVNGVSMDEPYAQGPTRCKDSDHCSVTLGPDEFYVLADNREKLSDSRALGPILGGNIVAVVAAEVWYPWE